MTGLNLSRFENWFLFVRDKLRLDSGRRRLVFLLFSLNALLIAIILLSIRNQEILHNIEYIYVDIEKLVEQLATIEARDVRIVRITATPLPAPTTTPFVVTATTTVTSTPTAPQGAAPPTSTLVPPAPTQTQLPTVTATFAPPIPTATLVPTLTPVPTATPVPTTTPLPTTRPTATPMPPPTDTPLPPDPEPTTILLTASAGTIPADGGSTINIRAQVFDQAGNPIPDGTVVTFKTNGGVFWGSSTVVVITINGVADVVLTSSTSAGTVTVTATSGNVWTSTSVRFVPVMQISKKVDRATAPTGSELIYTILAQNTSGGGEAANLLTLRDSLPAGFTYVSGSTTSVPAGILGAPEISGQELVWTFSPVPYSLAAGDTIQVAFRSLASSTPGIYANRAAISGKEFGTVDTGATASVMLSSATLTSITPAQGCNEAPVMVTIGGTNLMPGITAGLGGWSLNATWVDETTLSATVPQGIAAGVYDLVVTNPDGTSSSLSNAYRAQDCTIPPDTTLESGYLGTYGAEAITSGQGGDDDQVQVLFLQVPDGLSDPLYVRVYDPDCGGALDTQNGLAWDTPFTFTLYGGSGAYTHPDARSIHPDAGIGSGTVLATAVFTENMTTDGGWVVFGPFSAEDGELVIPSAGRDPVRGARIFKFSIVGGPEPPFTPGVGLSDLNVYNVVLSTSPAANTRPADARIFAFSWTFLIPQATSSTPPRLFPFVDLSVTTLNLHNWDYDHAAVGDTVSAGITMTTPSRTIFAPATAVSGDAEEQVSSYSTLDTERSTTWAISCWVQTATVADNLVTFWATDQNGTPLAIFTRSTNVALP